MTATTKPKKTAPTAFFDLSYKDSTEVRVAYDEVNKKVVISYQNGDGWSYKTIDPVDFAGVTFGDRGLRFAFGNERNNRIADSTGARLIFAGGGDDTIVATAGDIIDGGSGTDRVVIKGKMGDYSGSWDSNGSYLLTNRSTNKTITLRNVEQVIFNDGPVNPQTTIAGARSQPYHNVLYLGTSNRDALTYNVMTAGNYVIDGGSESDTAYFNIVGNDPAWKDYSISLNGSGQLVISNTVYNSTVTLINVEQIVKMYPDNDPENYNLIVKTAANDIINDTLGAIIFSGAGNDSITGGESNYFVNMGEGNDTLVDTEANATIAVIGGSGNDTYDVNDFDFIDYSALGSVIANVTFREANGASYSSGTVRKFSSLNPDNQYAVGTDTITTRDADGVFGTLITGEGNDLITVAFRDGCGIDIDAGGGANTITLTGANTGSANIYVGTGANSISSVGAISFYFTSYKLGNRFGGGQGYSVNLSAGQSFYYGVQSGSPIISTWNSSANGSFDFNENNCADTVVGSGDDDTVYLGSGDVASLVGGNDYAEVYGSATVDGGAGYDAIKFQLPDNWSNSLSAGQTQESVKFTLITSDDSSPSSATWERFKADGSADGREVSSVSGFEKYIIDVVSLGDTKNRTGYKNVLENITVQGSTRSERFVIEGITTLESSSLSSALEITMTGGGGSDVFEFADLPTLASDRTPIVKITDFDSDGIGKDRIDLTSLVDYERDFDPNYYIYVEIQGNMATIRTTDTNGGGMLKIDGGSHQFTTSDFFSSITNSHIKYK